jgi:peptidoglycan/LPS O-acetylase OafA/YrhL
MKRQIELDFIRGIAIMLVLHFHFSSSDVFVYPFPELPLVNFGWAGVDLFFVLSGFLVGGLLCREWAETGSVDAMSFLKRRAFKIWPGYYALIAAYVVTRKQPLNTFLWGNLLNVQNYVGSTISHSWSLAVEEHFYLVLSLAIWWCASRGVTTRTFLKTTMIVVVVVAIYRTFLAVNRKDFFFPTHTRMDALLLGVMLAVLFRFYRARFLELQAKTILWALVLAAAIVILFLFPQFDKTGVQIVAADLGSVALIMLLNKPGREHTGAYNLVARIGAYSYGIYLWHNSITTPVMAVLNRIGVPWLQYPVRVAAAILFGVLMSKLIEAPFLRLREKMVPSSRRPPVVAAYAGSSI